jgi:hypothetical protein
MYSNSKNGVHQTPSHSSTAGMPAYSRIIVSRLILALSPQMFKTITLPQQHNCYTEDTEATRQAARKLATKNNNNNNPMHSQTYNKNKSNERQTTTSLIHNVSYYSLVSSAVSLIAILLRSVDFTYATTTMTRRRRRRRRRRGALGHTLVGTAAMTRSIIPFLQSSLISTERVGGQAVGQGGNVGTRATKQGNNDDY